MSGKTIVFKKEVMSPVFGSFLAGDVAKNVDAAWAADLISAGAAAETSAGGDSQKKDQEKAADEAGRLTDRTAAEPSNTKVEHSFSVGDGKRQQELGVTGRPVDEKPAPVAAAAPAVAAKPAGKGVAAPAQAGKGFVGEGSAPIAPDRKTRPVNPPRQQAALAGPSRGAKTVDKPTKAAKGGAGARMAATGTKAGGKASGKASAKK